MPTVAANSDRRTPIQARARQSRDAILEATARILETSPGAELPSTNRIAKVAGVSIGTLYQYFEDRDAILHGLCRQHADEMMALLRAHVGPLLDAPPREAVPAFVDAMIQAHAVAPRLHLALVTAVLAEGGSLLAEVQDPGHELVLLWLRHHAAELRPRDLDAAAFLLTHTVEAAIHGQLLTAPERLRDPAWRAELLDLLLRYLLP